MRLLPFYLLPKEGSQWAGSMGKYTLHYVIWHTLCLYNSSKEGQSLLITPLLVARRGRPHVSHTSCIHIPETSLQGENFHKSVENTIFVGTGCSLVAPKDTTPPHFAEKTSQIATKPQNVKTFLARKFPAIR